jgi:hypothetical protein
MEGNIINPFQQTMGTAGNKEGEIPTYKIGDT